MEASSRTSPYLQLAGHVAQLARTVQRRVDPVLYGHVGVRGRELFVLRAVETGESNPMRIAERLDMAPSSASRTFDRLADLGLIDRADDPDDRRKARLVLTARGRDVAHRARRHVADALHAAFADVPRAEVEDAARVLERLVARAAPEGTASRPRPAEGPVAPGADRRG